MVEQFVDFEQSLKLKELGFNEECLGRYIFKTPELKWSLQLVINKNNVLGAVSSPLWQQAFDWFENNHNLEGNIKSCREGENKYYYYSVNELYRPSTYRNKFGTKEQARLECLKQLIKLVENETN